MPEVKSVWGIEKEPEWRFGREIVDILEKLAKEREPAWREYEAYVLKESEMVVRTSIETMKERFVRSVAVFDLVTKPETYLGRKLTEEERDDLWELYRRLMEKHRESWELATRAYTMMEVLRKYGWRRHSRGPSLLLAFAGAVAGVALLYWLASRRA